MRAALLVLPLLALAAPAAAAAAATRPTTAQTLAAARALGVGDDAARLQERFLPAARLVPGGSASGRSHLGGAPDLPRGTTWPTCHGGHRLTLLAQLDLRELARVVPGATRARGTLAVFVSQVADPKTGMPEIDPWAGCCHRASASACSTRRPPARGSPAAPPRAGPRPSRARRCACARR